MKAGEDTVGETPSPPAQQRWVRTGAGGAAAADVRSSHVLDAPGIDAQAAAGLAAAAAVAPEPSALQALQSMLDAQTKIADRKRRIGELTTTKVDMETQVNALDEQMAQCQAELEHHRAEMTKSEQSIAAVQDEWRVKTQKVTAMTTQLGEETAGLAADKVQFSKLAQDTQAKCTLLVRQTMD